MAKHGSDIRWAWQTPSLLPARRPAWDQACGGAALCDGGESGRHDREEQESTGHRPVDMTDEPVREERATHEDAVRVMEIVPDPVTDPHLCLN